MTAIAHADGRVEIVDTEADPCFGCGCCAKWARNLDDLRQAVGEHESLHHHGGDPVPGCLVCQVAGGAIDGVGRD